MVSEVDVRSAIEKIPQIYAGPLKVDGVDLEIAPIQRAVRIVVVHFAGAFAFSARGPAAAGFVESFSDGAALSPRRYDRGPHYYGSLRAIPSGRPVD